MSSRDGASAGRMLRERGMDVGLPLTRRRLLTYAAAGVGATLVGGCSSGGEVPPSTSPSGVVYNGKPFDAQGATLNLGNWGGYWQDFQTKVAVEPFEKKFNCKVNYQSSGSFYAQMSVAPRDNPPLDIYSFDQDSEFQNKPLLVGFDQVKANCPNAAQLWPFAFDVAGVSWIYSELVHAYRTDLVDGTPEGFEAIFDKQFDGKRGSYITSNAYGIRVAIAANMAYGSGMTDWDAGLAKLDSVPWKITDFSGTMQGLLQQGEIVIAPMSLAETIYMQQQGIPVDAISWANVVRPVGAQRFGIAAETKQLKLAYAFLDWMLSTEVQQQWSEDQFWLPTNKTAELPSVLTDAGFTNDSKAVDGLNTLEEGWRSWFENQSDLVDRLNQAYT